jgi:hypothetical protein
MLRYAIDVDRNTESGAWGQYYYTSAYNASAIAAAVAGVGVGVGVDVVNGDAVDADGGERRPEFVIKLSTTFHNVKYLIAAGATLQWPNLIKSIAAFDTAPFGFGLRVPGNPGTGGGGEIYWNHNSMDVATLCSLGWAHVTDEAVKKSGKQLLLKLRADALSKLQADGSWKKLVYDTNTNSAQYYGVSLLSELGYFDRDKCFWTPGVFGTAATCQPGVTDVRKRIVAFLTNLIQKEGALAISDPYACSTFRKAIAGSDVPILPVCVETKPKPTTPSSSHIPLIAGCAGGAFVIVLLCILQMRCKVKLAKLKNVPLLEH